MAQDTQDPTLDKARKAFGLGGQNPPQPSALTGLTDNAKSDQRTLAMKAQQFKQGPQGKPSTTSELYKDVPGLIEAGNIDLMNRPVVKNPDGTSSTVSTMTINEDGHGVLLPTIINGKRVTEQQAFEHYRKTGEHMGKFPTEADADKFDQGLHNRMGWNGPPGSAQEKWQQSAK